MAEERRHMEELKDQIDIADKYGEAIKALALFLWMASKEEGTVDANAEIAGMVEHMEEQREFEDLGNPMFEEKIQGIENFVEAAQMLARHLIPKLRAAAEKGNDNGGSSASYGW
jgi:hypothetical protein